MHFSLQLPVFKAPPALTSWEINKQTKSSLEREELTHLTSSEAHSIKTRQGSTQTNN